VTPIVKPKVILEVLIVIILQRQAMLFAVVVQAREVAQELLHVKILNVWNVRVTMNVEVEVRRLTVRRNLKQIIAELVI